MKFDQWTNRASEAAMSQTVRISSAGVVLWLVTAAAGVAEEDEATYTRVITERAAKIVAQLKLDDADRTARLTELIADQYRGLRAIHDARDAKIAEAKPPGDAALAEAWTNVVRNQANLELFALHRQFVARLAAELTPDQLDRVKDGMTYGVVPLTYNRYVELLPNLTDAERATIRAHLIEAREYAMDAGSAEEKHAIFGKFKGRINNFLSRSGYDLKQSEKDWAARQEAPVSDSQ